MAEKKERHDFSEIENANILTNIEMLLTVQGKTKYKMAADLGMARSSFQNWNSKGNFPSADRLYKISKYLNTSMEFLMTGREAENNTPDHQLYLDIQNLTAENKRLVKELITRLH